MGYVFPFLRATFVGLVSRETGGSPFSGFPSETMFAAHICSHLGALAAWLHTLLPVAHPATPRGTRESLEVWVNQSRYNRCTKLTSYNHLKCFLQDCPPPLRLQAHQQASTCLHGSRSIFLFPENAIFARKKFLSRIFRDSIATPFCLQRGLWSHCGCCSCACKHGSRSSLACST